MTGSQKTMPQIISSLTSEKNTAATSPYTTVLFDLEPFYSAPSVLVPNSFLQSRVIMPHPVKVSLERWKNEYESTFAENMTVLLDTFRELKLLYPELGKYPDEIGPFEVALDYMEDFWIISLNVLNGYVLDGWAGGEDQENPSFYEPALSSRELRGAIRVAGGKGGRGGTTLENLGLKSFPLIGPLSDEDATLQASIAPSGSGTSDNSDLELHAFHDFDNGSDGDALFVGPPKTISCEPDLPLGPTTPRKLGSLNLDIFGQMENTVSLQLMELPPRALPELDNPEDQQHDEEARHRLSNGIKEQHVVGLAFATPSTVNIPGELREESLRKNKSDEPSEAEPRVKRARLMDCGPKSYDIGILLKLDEVREKILSTCGLFITDEIEEDLIQDAAFNLLLDLELRLDLGGVFQFQVLMVPGWEQSHDRLISAFLSMGFTREGEGKILNYRGYEESIVVLTMRISEWERYKYETRNVPKDLRMLASARGRDKGKGKGKADSEFPLLAL